MLSVSFSLALVAAMLFGIVLPGHHKEVDKFNGLTRGPIPSGHDHVVGEIYRFKISEEHFSPSERKWRLWECNVRFSTVFCAVAMLSNKH